MWCNATWIARGVPRETCINRLHGKLARLLINGFKFDLRLYVVATWS